MYQSMMHSAEAVIFNSTTEEFAQFLYNSIGFSRPCLHLYRWSICPSIGLARRDDGLHIAIITSLLGESYEPSRSGVRPYIQAVLNQGVHIHYYGDRSQTDEIDRFEQSLDPSIRKFFHMHDVILDQQRLVNEIQQYHAGWILHDHRVFSKMNWEIQDPFMQTALNEMPSTTVATSALTCGAAGLPVLINRSMVAAAKLFDGTAVPLTLEEVKNVGNLMRSPLWQRLLKMAEANRSRFSYKTHANKLPEFLTKLESDRHKQEPLKHSIASV
jgi:hypothetical protein